METKKLYDCGIPLLRGIAPDELEKLLACLGARTLRARKGKVLLREQCDAANVGVLLRGEVRATMLDPSGKRLVLARHTAGGIYGDVLSLDETRKSPVTVTAHTDAEVLLLPAGRLLNVCGKTCACHTALLRNMLREVSRKYFRLQQRLICVTRPSLREKVLYYLEEAAAEAGARRFEIPFDRASLADYLNSERSALSRELSAMKRRGLIDYRKNAFRLPD
ncbi:MAG: Crp/Fnr family transcriptional regulator [Oscillospiraceae bacterium]|jgi:CRP-like cAMP-binding protein|nr:Crp/Fnr family transcriptional regulator [Oscillospiraceae bacterium]